MKKGLLLGVAMVLVMALVGTVVAGELTWQFSPTDTPGIFVGKVIEAGGPAGKGFFGRTTKCVGMFQLVGNQYVPLMTSKQEGGAGPGLVMLEGMARNPGPWFPLIPATRVSQNNAGGNAVQAQGQIQGQLQGQIQGQQQGQVGINSGFTPPGHDK